VVCVLLLIFYSLELKESYYVVLYLVSGSCCGAVVEIENNYHWFPQIKDCIINDQSHKIIVSLDIETYFSYLFPWILFFGTLKTDDEILGCLSHIIIHIGTGTHFTVKFFLLFVADTVMIQSNDDSIE